MGVTVSIARSISGNIPNKIVKIATTNCSWPFSLEIFFFCTASFSIYDAAPCARYILKNVK